MHTAINITDILSDYLGYKTSNELEGKDISIPPTAKQYNSIQNHSTWLVYDWLVSLYLDVTLEELDELKPIDVRKNEAMDLANVFMQLFLHGDDDYSNVFSFDSVLKYLERIGYLKVLDDSDTTQPDSTAKVVAKAIFDHFNNLSPLNNATGNC